MKLTKSKLKQIIKETIISEELSVEESLGWIFSHHKLSTTNLDHPLAKIFLNADDELLKDYAGLTRQVGGVRLSEGLIPLKEK